MTDSLFSSTEREEVKNSKVAHSYNIMTSLKKLTFGTQSSSEMRHYEQNSSSLHLDSLPYNPVSVNEVERDYDEEDIADNDFKQPGF